MVVGSTLSLCLKFIQIIKKLPTTESLDPYFSNIGRGEFQGL